MSSKKGFFYVNHNVYYGKYPQQHISGKINVSMLKPDNIKTDVHFEKDDFAVTFYDNHAFTEPEYKLFEQGLEKIFRCIGIQRENEIDFSETEERLGITLPREIKILHSFLSCSKKFTEGDERFLSLDKLEIDGEILVFYKVKRTPVGLSLKDGALMTYYKKMWEYNAGGENFFYAMNRIVVKAICSMPFNKDGKVKGELKRTISPEEILENSFEGLLEILPEYQSCGNIILFNEKGALAWFRSNGFSANIIVGAESEKLLKDIMGAKLEDIDWSEKPLKNI